MGSCIDRWVDLEGPLFYQEWTAHDGPVFVCLHGLGGNHANWMRVAPELARRGRVLVPDMPGAGRTPRAGRSAGVAGCCRALSLFLRDVAGDSAVLLGNSLGGSIALLQAAVEPDTVTCVAASGSALPPAQGSWTSPVVLAGTAAYAVPLVGELLASFRIRGLSPEQAVSLGFAWMVGSTAHLPQEVVEAHVEEARAQKADPDSVAAFTEAVRSIGSMLLRPARARLYRDAVRCPVLVMHGGRDRVVPLEPTLAAVREEWEVRVFPELGHMIQLEAPEVFLRALDDWLRAIGPP